MLSTVPGSKSGLIRPVHVEAISIASVLRLSLRQPCMFAANSSLGAFVALPLKPDEIWAADLELTSASLVKRSEMLFSCSRLGR